MDIVLIAPRHQGVETLPYRPQQRALFPPLSLLTVAALTPPGHRVSLIDEGVEPIPEDLEADLVGITATTAAAPRAYEISDRLRAKGIPTVIGGIHASTLPDEAAKHADAVVVGEAEGLWPQVVKDASLGQLRKQYRSDQLPSLEALPPPRRDLINPRKYILPNTLQTTRGCPFACEYCSVTVFFGNTYRMRPVPEILAEVKAMPRGPLLLVDDNIMGRPSYARELFAVLRETGRRWIGQASMTMMKTPELIKEAARAGCVALFVGLETLSQRNLEAMGKSINVATRYRELVKCLHDAGIGIVGSFMFGLDDDDEGVFERTVDFAQKAKIDACLFSILTPLPGTRLYERLSSEGRILDHDWSHYDGSHVIMRPQKMRPEQLQEGFFSAYKWFYSIPSIVSRAFQSMGRHPFYWYTNLVWRKYLVNWIAGMERRNRQSLHPAEN